MHQIRHLSFLLLYMTISVSLLTGCGNISAGGSTQQIGSAPSSAGKTSDIQTGFIENQTLDNADGTIHYSYYLPDNYDPAKAYPLIVTMPGYDRMWFGEDSAGSNIEWNGVQAWTKLSEPVILISAQLTDWGETSARQANALTQYMIDHFSVDTHRIYAAGYSAVYIFMAQNDEYYGSQKARDAYQKLHATYEKTGLTDNAIDQLLQLQIPDNAYFNRRGIYNYHGGGSIVFDDETVLTWILKQRK